MEITSRELDANLILIIFSLKKKFNVFFGDSSTYKILLKKKLLSPGIVLTKSVTHGKKKSDLHNDFKSQGFILTSIDHEHGVLDNLNYKNFFIKSRIDKKELEKFDAFFCWGKYDYKNLVENFPISKNKFFLTGSNRVDAWKNIQIKNYTKDNEKKISIFSNFAFSNNKYSEKKIFSLKRKAGYYKRCPELLIQEKLFLSYQKKLIKKFVNLINFLVIKYPNYQFFFKPHPTENKNFWDKKLLNSRNLTIVNQKSSTSLIKESDLIIQTRCTTSVEATINSINNINFIPVYAEHGFAKFVDKFSNNAKNEIEVVKLINNLMHSKKKNIKKIKKLNARILFNQKIPSSEKMSLVFNNLSKKVENKKSQSYFYIRFYLTLFELYLDLKTYIYNAFYSYRNINDYKFEIFQTDKLYNKILRYSKIYKIKKKFRVLKLGKRFWLFENL